MNAGKKQILNNIDGNFLVPLIGGRWYISGTYCQLGDDRSHLLREPETAIDNICLLTSSLPQVRPLMNLSLWQLYLFVRRLRL